MVPAVWLYVCVSVCVCVREKERGCVALTHRKPCLCVKLQTWMLCELALLRISNSLKMLPPLDSRSCDQGAFNRDDKLFHCTFSMSYSHSALIRPGVVTFLPCRSHSTTILFSSALFLPRSSLQCPSLDFFFLTERQVSDVCRLSWRSVISLVLQRVCLCLSPWSVPCHAAHQQLLVFSDQSTELENEEWSFHSTSH